MNRRSMRLVQCIAVCIISIIILNVLPWPAHNTLDDFRYIVHSIGEMIKPP